MDLNDYAREANKKWWQNPETRERIQRNKGEQICLMHSELSKCLEGVRKGLMDDKLPHRFMEEVELADTLIRIFDYAGDMVLIWKERIRKKCSIINTEKSTNMSIV